MKKGLIGTSLSRCMKSILKGETSIDDISVIYEDSYCSNDNYENKYYILNEHCIEDIACDIVEKQLDGKSYEEFDQKVDDLIPILQVQASKLLQTLLSRGKIAEIKYRIPEGQTDIAQLSDMNGENITNEKVVVSGNEKVLRIDKKNYLISNTGSGLYETENCWFNNELELISKQLEYGDGGRRNSPNSPNGAKIKLLFPEYTQEIDEIIRLKKEIAKQNVELNPNTTLPGMDYDGILQKLNELVHLRGQHTAAEIGQGVGDVRDEEFKQCLQSITNEDKQTEQENQIQE